MELRISNLSKTYSNGVKALNGIILTIQKGVFGLLGPNGAGKSSLMKIVATLQEPDNGTIIFEDKFHPPIDIINQKEEAKKTVGYLPQAFGFFPKLDAESLLNHLAILNGFTDTKKRKQTVDDLLEKTNLIDVKNESIEVYSSGMKQRLGIAQALLGNPKILLLDEPTTGLDPEERNFILNLLNDLSNDKIIIVSTHIAEDIQELCKQFAIINNGQIVFVGSPGDVTAQLKGKVWKDQVKKSNIDFYRQAMNVISERMLAGETVVHVFSDEKIAPHAVEVEPSLTDFYLYRLKEINNHGNLQYSYN